MKPDSTRLSSAFTHKPEIAGLQPQARLTHLQEQDWHSLRKKIQQDYINIFARPLDGSEDEWTQWQKRYGPGILAAHHDRTASEIEGFLDFSGCDPHFSKRIGEIMRIHDCGKADPEYFTPEDWVQQERPDEILRAKRRQHTERSQFILDREIKGYRALEGNDAFHTLTRQILGDHHNLASANPLIRAVAIIDAYDGDLHHHWPHQGEAPRDAMTEFRRLLGIDADQKYAGKTDTALVLEYARVKQKQGADVEPGQLQRELEEIQRHLRSQGPTTAAASIKR